MADIFEDYKRIQQKFGLPHLDKLKTVFQLEIEPECDLDEIRNEISNRLFEFTERVIEPLMWSNQHCSMIEREMLHESEGHEIFELYREIQTLRWRNNLLSIKPEAKGTAEWIRDLWTFWKTFEIVGTKMCLKFANGWQTLKFKEVDAEYHG